MKILITGPTGLVGQSLLGKLLASGHEVQALARDPAKVTALPRESVFSWSDHEPAPAEAFCGLDAVVHLAGEPIAGGRWTPARKRRLLDSRVRGTKNLLLGIREVEPARRPRVLISASATGFYGDAGEAELTEESPAGDDFLATICRQWEAAAQDASALGLSTVLLRTGIVLAKEGGALAKMGPFVLGRGRQWMSWIHLEDLIRFIEFAIHQSNVAGPYNLVSPEPVRNSDFTRALARARGFPFVVPAPAFALRLALGELASVLLGSQKAVPVRAREAGFAFRFPQLEQALTDIYGSATPVTR